MASICFTGDGLIPHPHAPLTALSIAPRYGSGAQRVCLIREGDEGSPLTAVFRTASSGSEARARGLGCTEPSRSLKLRVEYGKVPVNLVAVLSTLEDAMTMHAPDKLQEAPYGGVVMAYLLGPSSKSTSSFTRYRGAGTSKQ